MQHKLLRYEACQVYRGYLIRRNAKKWYATIHTYVTEYARRI